MSTLTTISAEIFVCIFFAILNVQVQVRLIAAVWANGCSWKQMLEIYDLSGKYRNWMIFDFVANAMIMGASSLLLSSLNIGFSPIVLGLFGLEALSFVCLPIRFVSTKIAMKNNPNLLDFNGKYKNTFEEYKKLSLLLDEKKLTSYKKSASKLWNELLLLNKRRNEAYSSKRELLEVKADVQKLIASYTMENDVEKRLKAQARLNKILKREIDIEQFTTSVEEQIGRCENIFMDIRTKLSVGQSDNVLPDLSEYTGRVKALEYTVESIDKD